MEFAQERVPTLHDLSDPTPEAPTDEAAVVVPMTDREYQGLAAERVLATLERVDPARVVVPLRAPAEEVGRVAGWLDGFDLALDLLWCDGPRLSRALADAGLDGERGKGRDVWLALGRALREEYVVLNDADPTSYDRSYVRRLLFPLARGFEFAKAYYARVEEGRLYGRLCRLLYDPLVRTLAEERNADVLDFLGAFRYALAGEFAATRDLARRLRLQRTWGMEVGVLGDAFDAAGFDGSAQVDLGVYEHDHRSVGGPTGLSDMSRAVASATLRAVEERGVDPDYATLPGRYRAEAGRLIRSYAADAAFNGFGYDPGGERDQVERYADAVAPPGPDRRLPAWRETPVEPDELYAAAREDLREAR